MKNSLPYWIYWIYWICKLGRKEKDILHDWEEREGREEVDRAGERNWPSSVTVAIKKCRGRQKRVRTTAKLGQQPSQPSRHERREWTREMRRVHSLFSFSVQFSRENLGRVQVFVSSMQPKIGEGETVKDSFSAFNLKSPLLSPKKWIEAWHDGREKQVLSFSHLSKDEREVSCRGERHFRWFLFLSFSTFVKHGTGREEIHLCLSSLFGERDRHASVGWEEKNVREEEMHLRVYVYPLRDSLDQMAKTRSIPRDCSPPLGVIREDGNSFPMPK